jgi:hypothetical protein
VLEVLQQFACQAHGPVGVVSDRTVDDLDLQHAPSHRFGCPDRACSHAKTHINVRKL